MASKTGLISNVVIYSLFFVGTGNNIANSRFARLSLGYNAEGELASPLKKEVRAVISNPGGLLEGLSLRSLLNVSVRRNELIADMFARMEKVERMGTGIRRMRDAMKTSGPALPKIESNLFFTITFMRPLYSLKESAGSEIGSEKSSEKILCVIESDRNMSASKMAEMLGIGSQAIEKQTAKLKSEGKLKGCIACEFKNNV